MTEPAIVQKNRTLHRKTPNSMQIAFGGRNIQLPKNRPRSLVIPRKKL